MLYVVTWTVIGNSTVRFAEVFEDELEADAFYGLLLERDDATSIMFIRGDFN